MQLSHGSSCTDHVTDHAGVTWLSCTDHVADHTLIRHVISEWPATWSVHEQARDQCLIANISLHWSLRTAFLSLLAILWTLHSDGYIFPFLLCFWLLFFSQIFVWLPQTAILLFCIYFSWEWSCSLSSVQCHEPPSVIHQGLCLSDLVFKSISHFHCIYFSFCFKDWI